MPNYLKHHENSSLIPHSEFHSPFHMLKEFFSSNSLHDWGPKVDLKETPKNIVLTAELAGFEKKNIQVDLNDNILTISGHRKKEEQKEEHEFSYHERYYGSFERSFDLNHKVSDKNKPVAKFENGILTVTLDKNPELQSKSHKIDIQ